MPKSYHLAQYVEDELGIDVSKYDDSELILIASNLINLHQKENTEYEYIMKYQDYFLDNIKDYPNIMNYNEFYLDHGDTLKKVNITLEATDGVIYIGYEFLKENCWNGDGLNTVKTWEEAKKFLTQSEISETIEYCLNARLF